MHMDRAELRSLGTTPIVAMNGGLFVSPGYGFHKTRILDSYELIFVIQGSIDLFEESESYAVQTGQTLVLSPGRRHGAINPYTPELRFFWIHFLFRDRVGGDFSIAPEPSDLPKVRSIRVPKTATIDDAFRLEELFQRFVSDQESGGLTANLASRLLVLILCEIARQDAAIIHESTDAVQYDRKAAIVANVRDSIDGLFSEQLSVSQLAKSLGLNPDYLERVYHNSTGERITEAINRKRIDVACSLLRDGTAVNVTEIAWKCGFNNATYFHRMFRRYTGLTPKRFRALYPRIHINTH